MALTTTLADLRDAVQRTADVKQFTDRHPTASIDALINRGLGALNRIIAIVSPNWKPLASEEIDTDGIETVYELPASFRSLISLEYTGDGRKTWLVPFELHERADLTAEEAISSQPSPRARAYRVNGAATIELLPKPPAGHTALIWYSTTASQIANSGDTVEVMDRLDDYVIWWAAREIAIDRGDWVRRQALSDQLAEIRGDIEVLARQRDMSAPPRPVDLCLADRYGRRRY